MTELTPDEHCAIVLILTEHLLDPAILDPTEALLREHLLERCDADRLDDCRGDLATAVRSPGMIVPRRDDVDAGGLEPEPLWRVRAAIQALAPYLRGAPSAQHSGS